MKLDESLWVLGGGRTAEWRSVRRRRLDEVRAGLRAALRRLSREAPAPVRARRYGEALRFLIAARGPRAERVLEHPALDYWLSLSAVEDWHLHFGVVAGFAASLALQEGKSFSGDAVLDPDGSFYIYGLPWALDFAAGGCALASVSVKGGVLRLEGDGFEAVFDPRDAVAGGPLRRLEEAAPGIVVDDRGWLQVHGVTMHGLARLDDGERRRFSETIRRAVSDMAERDPLLHAEMTDLLQVLVPLVNTEKRGSVSSSYATLRGLIALSPSDDALLQAETLIHEFCHMKLNQLLAADPVLLPGQSGQVFYSPWRPDARRLRGLLIGAHAFLNVGRYLARSLAREEYSSEDRLQVMTNVARRLFEVETALQASIEHGSYTAFGREFVMGMWRELGLLRHAALWFPPALLAEQKAACAAHYAEHALSGTFLHKRAAELADRVPRAGYAAAGTPL
ncbi:MAG: aKG-HExxH-type peptide beta-hydroxylase [Elusimicrobiota bacterium]